MKPKLLFLDEVNAGLNSAEVERATSLIHQLAARGITIVMIEHLMKVVLNVCTRIAVLHNGGLIADGHPVGATGVRQVFEAYQHLSQQAGARQIENVKRFLTFNMGGSLTTSVAMVWGRD